MHAAGWNAGFELKWESGESGMHQYLLIDKTGFCLETGSIELRMPGGQVTTIP